jgi:hypothetical protein
MSNPFLRAYLQQAGVQLPPVSSNAVSPSSGGWTMPCPVLPSPPLPRGYVHFALTLSRQYTNAIKAISFIGKSSAAAVPLVKSVVCIVVAAHGARILHAQVPSHAAFRNHKPLTFYAQGVRGIYAAVMRAIRSLPGIDVIVQSMLNREVSQTVRQLTGNKQSGSRAHSPHQPVPFPAVGIPPAQLLKEIEDNAAKENLCENGRLFALVYDGAVPQSHQVASIMQAQLAASGAPPTSLTFKPLPRVKIPTCIIRCWCRRRRCDQVCLQQEHAHQRAEPHGLPLPSPVRNRGSIHVRRPAARRRPSGGLHDKRRHRERADGVQSVRCRRANYSDIM